MAAQLTGWAWEVVGKMAVQLTWWDVDRKVVLCRLGVLVEETDGCTADFRGKRRLR
jgi:hypothetical protein